MRSVGRTMVHALSLEAMIERHGYENTSSGNTILIYRGHSDVVRKLTICDFCQQRRESDAASPSRSGGMPGLAAHLIRCWVGDSLPVQLEASCQERVAASPSTAIPIR